MPKQLDKNAAKQLLRSPDTRVFRNQMLNTAWLIAFPILLCAYFTFVCIVAAYPKDVLVTVIIILIVNIDCVVALVLASRRYVMALTREGMYLSRVNTEDYRGPLSRDNLFVRWDEFTELKLSEGPVLSFRVKGERYGFTVNSLIISSRIRAKKHQPFVDAICSYSGYVYQFQKGKEHTWQYIFATPDRTANFEADATDWDTLQPVTP